MDDDQAAARDVVLELFSLLNQYAMDDSLTDYTPIADITHNDGQLKAIQSLEFDRQDGVIQVNESTITVLAVDEVKGDESDALTITVETCVDATEVDVIDKESEKSVLTDDRDPVNRFFFDVVEKDGYWVVEDIKSEVMQECL